jgi:poly(ADP-ribose) glycohydrolase ARH3
MQDSNPLRRKFLGAMIGMAAGDAIGELAFHCRTRAQLLAAVESTSPLRYTDDTAMARGLAASLIRNGHVNQTDLGETFRQEFHREPWRGYAAGPPTIFNLVEKQGLGYVDAARSLFSGQGSYGNGAAMRIAPLGLCFHNDPRLTEEAVKSALITHAHPIGVDGAVVVAHAVAQAARSHAHQEIPPDAFLSELALAVRTPIFEAALEHTATLLASDAPPEEAGILIGGGVAAHESVPFAIYAFLRHPTSFQDCLLCAALNSGDRDTVAAMACAISGAYLGATAIPEQWREKVEDSVGLADLATRLFNTCRRHEPT